jgi:hypothetical protein
MVLPVEWNEKSSRAESQRPEELQPERVKATLHIKIGAKAHIALVHYDCREVTPAARWVARVREHAPNGRIDLVAMAPARRRNRTF